MPGTFFLGNSANIQNCRSLHQELTRFVSENDIVLLDGAQLESVDLTFLQIVEALRNQARAQGKQVALSTPANGPLSALLERAGFASSPAASDQQFWFHEGSPQ